MSKVLITFNLLLIINIMCNNLKCKFCGSNRINKRGKQKTKIFMQKSTKARG